VVWFLVTTLTNFVQKRNAILPLLIPLKSCLLPNCFVSCFLLDNSSGSVISFNSFLGRSLSLIFCSCCSFHKQEMQWYRIISCCLFFLAGNDSSSPRALRMYPTLKTANQSARCIGYKHQSQQRAITTLKNVIFISFPPVQLYDLAYIHLKLQLCSALLVLIVS